jgi:hypothetical protein
MSLKDEVRWASEHDPYTKVIPVEALRAWLGSKRGDETCCYDEGYNGAIFDLLVELEGVA